MGVVWLQIVLAGEDANPAAGGDRVPKVRTVDSVGKYLPCGWEMGRQDSREGAADRGWSEEGGAA